MEEFQNKVYCIDNLKLLCDLPNESVDLVYIDPPFFTQRDHKTIEGVGFDDKFESITHYIEWMKVRVREIHRILKDSGCLFLHCDVNASHRLRVMLDDVFGEKNFRNEIIWQRKKAFPSGRPKKLPNCHDTIFYYSKADTPVFNPQFTPHTKEYLKTFKHDDKDGQGPYSSQTLMSPSYSPTLIFNYKGYPPPVTGWQYTRENMEKLDNDSRLIFPKKKNGMIRRKAYLRELKGTPLRNIWADIPCITKASKEYRGYPTQKKEALLERIIKMGSNEGDIVADFFCGSGTTPAVAKRLGRKYIACDSNPDAVKITKERLNEIPE